MRRASVLVFSAAAVFSSVISLVSHADADASQEVFEFIALGDTAYMGAQDFPAYEALIEAINTVEPAFSIHVGDIGALDICTESGRQIAFDHLQSFTHPVFLTPGDNEWTDCWTPPMGERDPYQALSALRQKFFGTPKSLGQNPLPLTRQGDVSSYTAMVENARWRKNGVVFSTTHITGSNNNLRPEDPSAVADYQARTEAAIAWLEDTFAVAVTDDAKALVLVFHADMFHPEFASPLAFGPLIEALRAGAERFTKPILLLHGDVHEFLVDRPLITRDGPFQPKNFTHVTRLMVYGWPEHKAVRVHVEPHSSHVFSFVPLIPE